MGWWSEKEVELQRRHEEILIQREAILRGTERYYDSDEARALSFVSDFRQAKQRNERLLMDIAQLDKKLHRQISMADYKEFSTLKSNYWSMVRNVFPVWYDEQKQWERRHGSPRFSRSPRHSPTSPKTSTTRSANPAPQPSPRAPTPPKYKSPTSVANQQELSQVVEDQRYEKRTHSASPKPSPRKSAAVSWRPKSHSPDSSRVSEHSGPVVIPPLDLDPSMGEDVTTLSQVSAIPQSATAHSHIGTTPRTAATQSGYEVIAYHSQGIETETIDTRQHGMQTYGTSPPPSARGDISDNWAYTSHTPRSASPRGKSPSGKTPRFKSPKSKTPRDTTTPKSALASGGNGKSKGKKVQIKEDKKKSSKERGKSR